MAQMVKSLPTVRETWFYPWVRKISWRSKWQPTPIFLPGNPMDGGATVHGVEKSQTRLSDFTFYLFKKLIFSLYLRYRVVTYLYIFKLIIWFLFMSYANQHRILESGDTVNTVQGQQQLSEVICLWMQLCICLLSSFCGCVCVCVCVYTCLFAWRSQGN